LNVAALAESVQAAQIQHQTSQRQLQEQLAAKTKDLADAKARYQQRLAVARAQAHCGCCFDISSKVLRKQSKSTTTFLSLFELFG